MVLSKIEYSNAVNARYTFNPLWVCESVLMKIFYSMYHEYCIYSNPCEVDTSGYRSFY